MSEYVCPLCGSKAFSQISYGPERIFVDCPSCGRYEYGYYDNESDFNFNHLASYLLYHKYKNSLQKIEYRYNTTAPKEICDKYNQEFDNGNNIQGRPVHIDASIVETWYPKTFSERIDKFLLFLESRIPHIGQQLILNLAEAISALFVDRFDDGFSNPFISNRAPIKRCLPDIESEAKYMLHYLSEKAYISFDEGESVEDWIYIKILPDGYDRIDELQKYAAHGRNALVAMKFGNDTTAIREAIRTGVENTGYFAIFIDEVQHNDFITPELLKYIRDSKFVVVDLSHQNNGAYFEEGYAMGLGKPVIQLCKEGVKLHFDIAQKNTIIWSTEDDIPEKLANRIKATID